MAADPEESGYPCENCGEVFESKAELDEHMETAHGITPEQRAREEDEANRGD
jgi:uncharacterized C2H2 Zn-finger protein